MVCSVPDGNIGVDGAADGNIMVCSVPDRNISVDGAADDPLQLGPQQQVQDFHHAFINTVQYYHVIF